MNKIKIISIIMLVLLCQLTLALDFYTGDIIITSNSLDVDISDKIYVTSEYIFLNKGTQTEQVSLDFQTFPSSALISKNNQPFNGDLQLQPTETAKLIVTYNLDINPDFKTFELIPVVYFNDLINPNKIQRFDINIKLPTANSDLVTKSPGLVDDGIINNRRAYSYSITNTFSNSLNFKWIDFKADIDLTRTANQIKQVGDILEIIAIIKNNGDNTLYNIEIKDSFLAANYEPYSPTTEFTFIDEPNNPFYRWSKKIPALNAKEALTINYYVKVTNLENLKLHSLRAFINNIFIKAADEMDLTPFVETATPEASDKVLSGELPVQENVAITTPSDLEEQAEVSEDVTEDDISITKLEKEKPEIKEKIAQPNITEEKAKYIVSEMEAINLEEPPEKPKSRFGLIITLITFALLIIILTIWFKRKKTEKN